MEYTILILLLPVLSFLVLALAGMKMSHRAAGLVGSLSLGAVAVLSYAVAYGYFTLPRLADGTFGTWYLIILYGCLSRPACISTWASCSTLSR